MKTVYLDNAATTPMRTEVIEAVMQSMQQSFANASATYSLGRTSKSSLELSRKLIAKHIGVTSKEIIFTSGGTEANNLIFRMAITSLGIQRIITTKIEHHAVLKTVEALAAKYHLEVVYLPFTTHGDVDLTALETVLQQNNTPTLVSLMHINNEIGTILDLEKVGNLCEHYQAFFHTDTVQSIGHYTIDFAVTKVDFATASAHKFYGPKGVGFAYINKRLEVATTMYGGAQEKGLRPGTEPVALINGMATALDLAYQNLAKERAYILDLKNYAVTQLKLITPNIQFNCETDKANRNYNLLNIRLPLSSEKAATVLFQLDLQGICCSRGSACQSGSNQPSHVLAEVLTEEDLKYTSLRITFSIYNTKEEIDYLISCLKKIVSI